MTPQRWRRIDDLFDAALQLAPAERESWLQEACGGDEDLRAEVDRLLAGDERAAHDGFLAPPGEVVPHAAGTRNWTPPTAARLPQETGTITLARAASEDDPGGFTPRQAIAPLAGVSTVSEPPDLVRARLRELPLVYILIHAASVLWRRTVLGPGDPGLSLVDLSVFLPLVGLVALLWSRWPIPLLGLKALELGMIVLLAGLFAFGEYRLMLEFSLRGETMMAEMTLTSVVLLTSVLILTYGLYVPKSWRRAAVVVLPLSLLPFVPIPLLALRHPEAMGWLETRSGSSTTPLVLLFTYDGLILIILAVELRRSGARTISGLRRAAAETRRLGQYHLRERIGAGGMGEVYLADHRLLEAPCAIKLIRPEVMADPRVQVRFEREVQMTASFSHPNIVEVYDYGRSDDGTYYYVMEYLPGLSLEDLVRRYGPLPPGRLGVSAAASLPGVAQAPRGGADPPRHQAVEHHRRAAVARTTWPSCSTLAWSCPGRGSPALPSDRGGPGARHAAVHVAGAGDERGPGGGRAERPLRPGGGGLLSADRASAVRGRGRDWGHDRARPRPGGATLSGPCRSPRGPRTRRSAVPGQGPGRAVRGLRESGRGHGRTAPVPGNGARSTPRGGGMRRAGVR